MPILFSLLVAILAVPASAQQMSAEERTRLEKEADGLRDKVADRARRLEDDEKKFGQKDTFRPAGRRSDVAQSIHNNAYRGEMRRQIQSYTQQVEKIEKRLGESSGEQPK